jgi:serine/threonine protein kinase
MHLCLMFLRDLKLGNVLVDNPRTQHAKICDFGLARLARPTDMTGFVGTANYMAP